MKRNAPCLDCENRAAGCHATCEAYREWRIEKDALNKKTRDEKLDDWATQEFLCGKRERIRKAYNRKERMNLRND